MAEDLHDLGEPIFDRMLVLNIIRVLNERFTALGLRLQRRNPSPPSSRCGMTSSSCS